RLYRHRRQLHHLALACPGRERARLPPRTAFTGHTPSSSQRAPDPGRVPPRRGLGGPSEQLLTTWLELGDLVEALCTGLSARPFLQAKDKIYRRQGKAVQVGDETAHLDTMVVFAGASMSTLADAKPLDDAVKAARASYQRGQRGYRAQRNAERVKLMEAQVADRVRQMRERKAIEDAAKVNAGSEAESTGANGRKR